MKVVIDTNVLLSAIISLEGSPIDYIISGDRHLISLGGSVEGIPIVTPRQFLDECWGK